MGKMKRGRGGRSRRTKGNDSDDSDEDYMVEEDEDYLDEEDEDKVFSNEEYDDGEQYYNGASDDEYRIEGKYEEEENGKTAQCKRKRSGTVGMKLGPKAANNKRNVRRRYDESDDENETWEERLQVAEEEEEKKEVNITKRKRSCLDQKKWCGKVSSNRRNAHQEFDDEDYHVEEVEKEGDDDEEEEDQTQNFEVSEEDEKKEDQTQNFEVSEEDEEIDETTKSNHGDSCLDQKRLHTKTSNSRRNGHEKVNNEDYNFDDEEEEDVEDDEFTLDESFSLEKEEEEEEQEGEEDEDDEFTLDESLSLEEEEGEEDEDDEFTLDESLSLEEEEDEDHVVKKKKQNKNVIRRTSRKKTSGYRKKKRRRRVKVANRVVKKRNGSRNLRKNIVTDEDDDGDDCEDFTDINIAKIKTKKTRRGTRNFTVQSDSDFVDSGPSENEFTISEEEREQVREAINICRKSTPKSSCSYKIQENESSAPRRKPYVTKGKEKIPESNNEVVKQVCGICFTDERKNTVRGALDCCSHYFCFACIFEWSKVESRCPMCKQRFQAISKSAKANTGVDSRDLVVQIPERDQVYHPTEEEIRGYLDPYENVICTECREGGDDELMLLCDLCDSPAHTYCVGLGREVPEGNWYCEGCRPASLGSNNQVQDSITGQRNLFHRLSSFDSNRDDFDGSLSTPTPFLQGFGSFPSPRYLSGGIQASSPRSGTGVVTVSGRRQMHRQIQSMLSNHRSRQAVDAFIGDIYDTSQVNLSNSSHRTSSPMRTPEIGTSFRTQLYEESSNASTQQNMQFLPVSSNQLAGQLVLDTTPVLADINIPGTSRQSSISTLHNVQPIMFSGSSNVGRGYHSSSSALGEGSNFYLEEQVKHLVQNYVTSMSSTITVSLDSGVLEEIARKSNNTVLAACGSHHLLNEVFPVLPPICTHFENLLIPTSPLRDRCSSCFNNFVKEVVKTIMNSKLPSFLRVRS